MKTQEELKLQLGEVLPNAIQIMGISAKDAGLTLNGTVKEMMKLQQTGGLISSKVLPMFAKNLHEAAIKNGGLAAAIKSNRAEMNRLNTSMQIAADDFFQSGYSEGLTELFKATKDLIMENLPLWKSLGKVVGSTLKGLAGLVNGLTVALKALGGVLEGLTFLMGDFSALLLLPLALPFIKKMGMMTASVITFTRATAMAQLVSKGGLLGMAIAGGILLNQAVVPLLKDVKAPTLSIKPNGVKRLQDPNLKAMQSGTFSKNNSTINVKLDVDGETVASKVVNTQSMENHTDARISHTMGGS